MTPLRVNAELAYVLQVWPWKETSLLVDAFTKDFGRVVFVAKGAKRPASHFKGILTPFLPLSIAFSGKGEVKTLTHAEIAGAIHPLTGESIFLGFYLNDLLLRLLAREDAFPTVFADYVDTITEIETATNVERALRIFEGRLLRHLGYGLPEDTQAWIWDAYGMQEYFENETYAPDAILITPEMNRRLATEAFDDEQTLAFAKRLYRRMLAFYAGDKPLESRRILQKLRSYEAS